MQWISAEGHKSKQGSTENLFQLLSLPPLASMDHRFSRSHTMNGLEEIVDLGTGLPPTPLVSPPTPKINSPHLLSPKQYYSQPQFTTVQPSQLHQASPMQAEAMRVSILRHLPQFFPVTADPTPLALNPISPKMDTLQFAPSCMPNLLPPNTATMFTTQLSQINQYGAHTVQYGGHIGNQLGANIVSQFQLSLPEPVGLGIPLEREKPKHVVYVHSDSRDNKPKRKKTTDEQLRQLVAVFEHTDTPGFDLREELAQKTGMTNREVQVHFYSLQMV